MIDVTSTLVLLVVGLSFSGASDWLSRRAGWTRWPWGAVLFLTAGLALASLIWDYRVEIPAGEPLQWTLIGVAVALLGIGVWRHIRRDAADLRARRARS